MTANAPALASAQVQAFLETVLDQRAILFATGCGRSGTKLIQRCLATARAPVYYWGENELDVIHGERRLDGEHLIVKRKAKSHETFDLIPSRVKVVHIVRDPAQVFTSRVRTRQGYYIQPERWRAEWRAFKALEKRHPAENLAVVRYEDLMGDADAVQARLADHLGVAFDLPFSRHHERNHLDEGRDKTTGEARVWKPIDPRLQERHRDPSEGRARLAELAEVLGADLPEFQARFGYT